MRNYSSKALLIATAILYLVSVLLLVYASLNQPDNLPSWGGYLDVGSAILIAAASFTIFGMNQSKPNFETSHRAALYLLPVTLLGMWIFRNALDFNILLPGLAWRTFLFLHILPYGLNIWNRESTHE